MITKPKKPKCFICGKELREGIETDVKAKSYCSKECMDKDE